MVKKATRSRTAAKARTAKRAATRRKSASHVFAIKLRETPLNRDQAKKIASQIRNVTAKELLRMDFRVEELNPLRGRMIAVATSCGSGCSQCS